MPLNDQKRQNLLGGNLDRAGKKVSRRCRAPNQYLARGAVLGRAGHASQVPRDIS